MGMKRVLQVASLRLRSPPSLNVDYDLYYSPWIHPQECVNFEDRPVLKFRHVETMEDSWRQRRDLANAALDRREGVVGFWNVSVEECPDIAGFNGLTAGLLWSTHLRSQRPR